MAISKKSPSKGSRHGIDSNGGGRRYTMLPRPQTRDSVLSNGSSDRSSSVSDEPILSFPYRNDFFR